MLHTGMLKGFMDGSLGSRTAALNAPYSDDPSNSGIPRYDQAKLDAMTKERAAAQFQMGFHAIGDRAVEMALDAFSVEPERICSTTFSGGSVSFKILVFPARASSTRRSSTLLISLATSNFVSSPPCSRITYSPIWPGQNSASVTTARATPMHGRVSSITPVPLAFGTDYPVEPITPFRGIYAAVTRENEAGTQSYFPEEKLTIVQALYCLHPGLSLRRVQ